ncbi:MAG: thioredoxin family protein [Candidatus Aenigmatarchaeota archaeon]
MKKETKKQLFAVFVLLMFTGSSIAYAVSVVLGRQPAPEQDSLIYDKPLTDSEASKLLENNIVVADFYYSNSADSSAADSLITGLAGDLSGYLAVDKIDAVKYKSLADANGITQFPSFVLKGTTLDTVSGAISKQDLKSRICQLYAEPVAACG